MLSKNAWIKYFQKNQYSNQEWKTITISYGALFYLDEKMVEGGNRLRKNNKYYKNKKQILAMKVMLF